MINVFAYISTYLELSASILSLILQSIVNRAFVSTCLNFLFSLLSDSFCPPVRRKQADAIYFFNGVIFQMCCCIATSCRLSLKVFTTSSQL